MAVRVLRLMEYVYPDAEMAAKDMEKWQVQGTKQLSVTRNDHYIRSAVLAPDFVMPDNA